MCRRDWDRRQDRAQDSAAHERAAQFQAARQREFATTPPIVVDPGTAARYGARVLDPVTAMRLPGGGAPSPTVYVGERLLAQSNLRMTAPGDAVDELSQVAAKLGVTLEPVGAPPPTDKDLGDAQSPVAQLIARHWVPGRSLINN